MFGYSNNTQSKINFSISFSLFQTAECWRAAVDFTTKYLTAHGQGLVSMGQNQRTNLNPGILQVSKLIKKPVKDFFKLGKDKNFG